MYRANFSVETTCQSLRSNIVAMLDRRVEASTRHILVRRDVEAFEKTCGGVDPDATAAFKVLLAADKAPAVPAAVVAAKPVEAKPAAAARKTESRTEMVAAPPAAKPPAAKPQAVAAVEATPAPREVRSDVDWVDAVRRALVTHDPAPVEQPVKAIAVAPPATPIEPRKSVELVKPVEAPKSVELAKSVEPPKPVEAPKAAEPAKPAAVVQAPPAALVPGVRETWLAEEPPVPARVAPAATVAPALPPATPISIVPAPQPDDGHPVPPEAIPETAGGANTDADAGKPSRLREFADKIPLVGWAINR
jgi:hypothetical protein